MAVVGCGKLEGGSEAPRGQVGQAAVTGPDFVVTAVSGPASTEQGKSIQVSVTLCNQGTESDHTQVELLLSTDAIIEMPEDNLPGEDRRIGGSTNYYLYPGQCQTVGMEGYLSGDLEGAYYLGAFADPDRTHPELAEDNNSKAGNRLGIGAHADFIITSVTGPVSVEQGAPLTASVTVCNQGTVADSAQVELYLSKNRIITPPVPPEPAIDQPVGSVTTQGLSPGQCQTLAISGPASVSTPGAYYLGAAADPYNSRVELIEDNNTRAGNRMGVGSGSDFIVKAVSGRASVQLGQAFTASVTVCNLGTVGDSTRVELLLSSDATFKMPEVDGPGEDARVGSVFTAHLNPGQCQTLSQQASASVSVEGAYYLGAIADPEHTRVELIEDNNSRAGNRMGVGTQSDFIITAVTGPASVQYGQAFTASVTVCNQGTAARSTEVALYLSMDENLMVPASSGPNPDQLVGTVTASLGAGQCKRLSISGSPSVPEQGPYYLGAVADPYNSRAELIEDNNTQVGSRMGVGSKTDFIIKSVTAPASGQLSQSITVSVVVCNQGTAKDSTEVDVLLSADATLVLPENYGPREDVRLAVASTMYLEPWQCQTLSIPVSVSAYWEGAYYLGAMVDAENAQDELIEDNNTRVAGRFGIGAQSDFIITAVTGPASAQQGHPITGSATVCNQGTVSDSTQVALYLSPDSALVVPAASSPSFDGRVGTVMTPVLAPGVCHKLSISGPAAVPSEGAYYLGAVADPSNSRAELLEGNNTKAGNRIGVGYRSDFIVKAVSGRASAQLGQAFTASVTVCNLGTVGDSTRVELLLSSDATFKMPEVDGPGEDARVGSVFTAHLNPGQCQTLSQQASASVSVEGAYYLGAIADPEHTRVELIEDNNSRAGNRMGVGSQGDFIITAVTGPASVQYGQAFTASVTVCNQGTVAVSNDVALYLTADLTLVVPTSSTSYGDQLIGTGTSELLGPGQCQTLSVSGSTSGRQDGPYYLGAMADFHDTRAELIEDNNTRVGSRIGVGPKSDFIIKSVSGPTSAQLRQSITVSVVVCNQGTVSDVTRVDVLLSADATIVPPEVYGPNEDVRLGVSDSVDLDPGQCQTLSIPVSASARTEGTYYLGAMADLDDDRVELIEDNNAEAGNQIHITP